MSITENKIDGPMWKVVWANGEEAYVNALDRSSAIANARLVRDTGTVPIIYCEVYG